MKILHVSDWHGRDPRWQDIDGKGFTDWYGRDMRTIVHTIDKAKPDMLIMTGDMLGNMYGDQQDAIWQTEQLTAGETVVNRLLEQFANIPVLYLMGNHEFVTFTQARNALARYPNLLLPQAEIDTFTVNGVNFLTVMGSLVIPNNKVWCNELTEDRFAARLSYASDIPHDVLVCHGPPHKCLDSTYTGEIVGSPALRSFIMKHQPKLFLCGHIHESRGMASLGSTLCYNSAETAQLIGL